MYLDGELIEDETGGLKNDNLEMDADMESDAGRAMVMLRLYNATASSDVVVRAKAYEVLNYISTAKYLHLQPYAKQLVERTVEGLKKEDDIVVHKILELWMSIAEMEGELEYANIPSHELVNTHAQELIPAVLAVLPSRVSDLQYVEEIVSPPKSIFTAAVLTLWLLVEVLPEDVCMQLMVPFVGRYIPSSTKDWRLRKAAVAVLAFLCGFDEAETLVRSSVGLVIEAGISSLIGSSSSTAPNSGATSSSIASTSNTTERNLSLSDSAAFCIFQISEHMGYVLEDRWELIVNWMAALDVTKKSEFIILSSLIDSASSFISFAEDEEHAVAALLPALSQFITLFEKWTSQKEILQFPRQCVSLFNGLETLMDLFSEDNQLDPHKAKLEKITRNVLEILESESSASSAPFVIVALLGTYSPATLPYSSFETITKLVNLCLRRGNSSTNFEELQEIILCLTCIITHLEEKFEPFVGPTCEFILKLLREASFGADDESSIIPVSEIRPQDEEDEDYEGAELEADYLGAKPDTKLSKRSASGKLLSSSTSRSKVLSEGEDPSSPTTGPNSTVVAPSSALGTPSKRKEQVHKSNRIIAKNVVLEDCLRLIESIMPYFPKEKLGHYTKDLQVALLEFTLRVPPSFVSLLSTLALALSSILRTDSDLVETGLRPILKLIEQLTKAIAGDDTQQTIYHALLTAFTSAIVSCEPNKAAHYTPLLEAFEVLLTLLKQANKSDDDEEPDEVALSDSVSLIGDYMSIVGTLSPPILDSEKVERLRSTFEMILGKWLDPDSEVVERALRHFTPSQLQKMESEA